MTEAKSARTNIEAQVSITEAKLTRIEELSDQIRGLEGRLESFWTDLSTRLAAIGVEAWCDDVLESPRELIFPSDDSGADTETEPCETRGLQFGFIGTGAKGPWRFVVRPARLHHGAAVYARLEKPEAIGEPRPLEDEPAEIRLAALGELPFLLDAVLREQNDSLAVIRRALGDPVETHAMVGSPFSSRKGTTRGSVISIGQPDGANDD